MPFAGTSDVAEVAKNASLVIRNGSITVGVQRNGTYDVHNTVGAYLSRAVGSPSATAIETKLTTRFDDPTYYSA